MSEFIYLIVLSLAMLVSGGYVFHFLKIPYNVWNDKADPFLMPVRFRVARTAGLFFDCVLIVYLFTLMYMMESLFYAFALYPSIFIGKYIAKKEEERLDKFHPEIAKKKIKEMLGHSLRGFIEENWKAFFVWLIFTAMCMSTFNILMWEVYV